MSKQRYWRNDDERKSGGSEPVKSDVTGADALAFLHGDGDGKFLSSRRDFLKLAGFCLGAAAISACRRAPIQKLYSAATQPEDFVPGRAVWYASTCGSCSAGCGVLVKNRDGRPIKLEGNPSHGLSRGGMCAVGQASLLELYDERRLANPLLDGRDSTWDAVDHRIDDVLSETRRTGGSVRVLSGSILSPTLRTAIDRFLAKFADGRHVVHDPISASAILDACQQAHGARVLPRYRFDRARVIVSFDADFLGTWISPVEFAAGYRESRDLDGDSPRWCYHAQVESRLSLTGTNADERIVLGPFEIPVAMAHLARIVARATGASVPWGKLPPCPMPDRDLRAIASRLLSARGRGLVVCGLNDVPCQLMAAFMNDALGNTDSTVDLARPSLQKQGNDGRVQELLHELELGKVGALFIIGSNPLAELPQAERWRRAIERPKLTVSLGGLLDETVSAVHAVCPEPHYLESWSDAEPVEGLYSLAQPVLEPMGRTRPAIESFARWSGDGRSTIDLVRDHWRASIFPRQSSHVAFENLWNQVLRDGWMETPPRRGWSRFSSHALAGAPPSFARESGGFTLVLHPTVAILDGRHAHNPWLQELPDPVTKIVWDNHVSISPAAAARLGIEQGDVVRVTVPGGASADLPAHIQPGQHDGTAAVAIGYGRATTRRFADAGPRWLFGRPTVGDDGLVGKNAESLATGPTAIAMAGVTIAKTGRRHALATTQTSHTLEIPARLASRSGETRDVVREATFDEFLGNPSAGNEPEPAVKSLWGNPHASAGPRWGMAVDLSACIGCSACVLGCQAENNVPVVGKDEVARRRDMHWIRIDRYYSGRDADLRVVHQPMMCHHCGNAPCETVCPVLATMHSSDGLNQQVYNRCVGTRYCANNCPYKVRRFNWFEYQKEGRLANLALNPDVTVRSRGVMEKCTFCVQRIQEARVEAARRGEPLRDGDIQPACAQSCPTKAILFGDLNDPHSRIARLRKCGRYYRVLAELNVDPSVGYLVKIRGRGNQGAR